jgi:hypothetical protein
MRLAVVLNGWAHCDNVPGTLAGSPAGRAWSHVRNVILITLEFLRVTLTVAAHGLRLRAAASNAGNRRAVQLGAKIFGQAVVRKEEVCRQLFRTLNRVRSGTLSVR